jgi:diguanylate cyclase (GGDEF)-like protein
VSLYTGWYFSVDDNNIYHRGYLFFVHLIICYSLFAYPVFFVYKNRNKLEKKYYYSLLLFFAPQVIGTTIQVLFYGVSFNWVGMMISLLIIYFNIQNRSLKTDYLTGAYNRLHIDDYLQQKIKNVTAGNTFSLILLDLNYFKEINDEFGHTVGDDALKDTVSILRSCFRQNDFVARYGGDEFIVILDINNRNMLEEVINRIYRTVDKFNNDNNRPYKLSFCMGYDLYDSMSEMDGDSFIKHLDMLMYDNKKKKKINSNTIM